MIDPDAHFKNENTEYTPACILQCIRVRGLEELGRFSKIYVKLRPVL
jgi:hypothetical protein